MNKTGLNRLYLHARSLSFEHPKTGERVKFEAPIDAFLDNALKALR